MAGLDPFSAQLAAKRDRAHRSQAPAFRPFFISVVKLAGAHLVAVAEVATLFEEFADDVGFALVFLYRDLDNLGNAEAVLDPVVATADSPGQNAGQLGE